MRSCDVDISGWDTSLVRDMQMMFYVRCSLRPALNLHSHALHAACTAIARRLCHSCPGPQLARTPCALLTPRIPPRTVCPACDPRQHAVAFNHPLSWDTSRVTNMRSMFYVRSSPRALHPQPSQSRPHTHTCTRRLHRDRTPPPAASHLPRPVARHRVPCLRPSAERAGLQPAAELGHLPRHGHVLHVFRALLPCTHCALPRPAASSRLSRRPAASPAPCALCLRPSTEREGLQPVAELGHLPRRVHELHVQSSLLPAPHPPHSISRTLSPAHPLLPCTPSLLHTLCVHTAAGHRLPPPHGTARPAPYALLATLGTDREGLQPASEL